MTHQMADAVFINQATASRVVYNFIQQGKRAHVLPMYRAGAIQGYRVVIGGEFLQEKDL